MQRALPLAPTPPILLLSFLGAALPAAPGNVDMGRRSYSDETKAAVMAELMAGQSISEVAREYKIPRGTVGYWSAQLSPPNDQMRPNEKSEIGALLFQYLCQTLETLTTQQELFADETWLREQSASERAVLHGVSTDKAIRLLEALEGPSEDELP